MALPIQHRYVTFPVTVTVDSSIPESMVAVEHRGEDIVLTGFSSYSRYNNQTYPRYAYIHHSSPNTGYILECFIISHYGESTFL